MKGSCKVSWVSTIVFRSRATFDAPASFGDLWQVSTRYSLTLPLSQVDKGDWAAAELVTLSEVSHGNGGDDAGVWLSFST